MHKYEKEERRYGCDSESFDEEFGLGEMGGCFGGSMGEGSEGFGGGNGFGNGQGAGFGGGQGAGFGGGQGQGQAASNGFIPGCPRPVTPTGRNRVFNNSYNVNGQNASVVNKDFYNNYYNRYNHYYVRNVRVDKNYVYDYNIVHLSSQTCYAGCQHLGSKWIVDNGCGGNNGNGNSCGCGC